MTHRVCYRTVDLEQVKYRLQGILSCNEKEAAEFAKNEFPDEIAKIVSIFNNATESLHHKWVSAIVGNVPSESWVKGSHGELEIEPGKDSTLRLSSFGASEEFEQNMKIAQVRERVFAELLNKISPAIRKHYKPMLSWISDKTEGQQQLSYKPFSSDTVFGYLLCCFEKWMDIKVHLGERQWAHAQSWPKDQSVPTKLTMELSRRALKQLQNILEEWFEVDAVELKDTPNSLLALVSANLSANRVLLEFAANEARGREATSLVLEVLQKLNAQGITEVPIEMDHLEPHEERQKLKEILTNWFVPNGLLIGADSGFRRPMNYSDIDLAVRWSKSLQESYLVTRGQRGGPIEARFTHGSSAHLFIFGITVVGAFYSGVKTDNEFKGKSNPSYAVFPGRKLMSKGAGFTPPAHAEELLKQAYGQIYFGNTGWNILADRVQEYAEMASVKRAHIEQLIRFATKNRSSASLLGLSKRVAAIKDGMIQEYQSQLATPLI